MAKCPKCQARKGKRFCPALEQEICSQCCGTHRLESIPCPQTCTYLASEHYQLARRKNRAQTQGRAFIESLMRLFATEDRRKFAFYLQADVYWWMKKNGPLTNDRCSQVLDELKSRLSPLFVPPSRPEPLARFLYDLISETPRYIQQIPRSLNRDRRLRCLAVLADHIRNHGGADTLSYHDELAGYFGQLDFEADLDYSPAEELERKRSGKSPKGFHESAGGLILPGQ